MKNELFISALDLHLVKHAFVVDTRLLQILITYQLEHRINTFFFLFPCMRSDHA